MSESDLDRWNTMALTYWASRKSTQKWVHEYILFPEFSRILSSVNAASILDFGCGDGSLTNYLRAQFSERSIWGHDKSEELLNLAKHTYPGLNFVDSMQNLTFDAICMNMVLQDVSDPVITLKELRDKLNSDGCIILSIPHPVFSLIESHHLTTERRSVNPSGEHDIKRYRYEETEEVYWGEEISVPTFLYNRTIASYSCIFRQAGYEIDEISEPLPTEEGKHEKKLYKVHDEMPHFMVIVLRKGR